MRNIEPKTATVTKSETSASASLTTQQFQFQNIPPIIVSNGRFTVKIAETNSEVEAALRLRYKVFNVEFGNAEDTPFGLDVDEFDATSHHLIVQQNSTAEVVGVYRLRTLEIAKTVDQFYSSQEFKLENLPENVLKQSIEIGRASIAKNYRHKNILFLLWKGLADYIRAANKRFVFGCCSLFSQDFAVAQAVFRKLEKEDYLWKDYYVKGQKNFDFTEEEKLVPAVKKEIELPQLFNIYLRIGAKVCSPPVIDRKFGTIDFFVVFDVENLDRRYRSIFFGL